MIGQATWDGNSQRQKPHKLILANNQVLKLPAHYVYCHSNSWKPPIGFGFFFNRALRSCFYIDDEHLC